MEAKKLQKINLQKEMVITTLSRYLQEKMINNINRIIEEYYNFEQKISDFMKNNNQFFMELLEEVKQFKKFTNLNNKFDREIFNTTIKKVYSDYYEKFKKFLDDSIFIKKIRGLNEDINILLEYEIKPDKIEYKDNTNEILEINTDNIKAERPEEDSSTTESGNPYNIIINESGLANNESYNNFEDNEQQNTVNSKSNVADININNNIEIRQLEFGSGNNNEYNQNDNDNDNSLKCSICKINQAIKMCSHCNIYYCEGCSDTISRYDSMNNHILKMIPPKLLDRAFLKKRFLNNFISFFKYYLKKCNYLLNEDLLLNLPLIDDIKDFESQKNYLSELNQLKLNDIDDDNDNEIINGNLIIALETIFKNKKLHLSDNINDIDDNFYSDEAIEILEAEFEKIKNQLFYYINVVSKDNVNLDLGMDDVIINKIYNTLSIDKNNIFILFNDKIDNFVKSKNFKDLYYKNFEIRNPICNKLKELQLLKDEYLCNLCKIPNNCFDYRGNTLNPNSNNNLKRGTEKYDPPYGWIGIGLNVLGKYDSDEWITNNTISSEWAIAYHGINIISQNSSNIIKKLLKYIISQKRLNKEISKRYSKSNDKRNWGKVGEGILLMPNIGVAEHYAGTISFDGKQYKFLFMARVYIKGIRVPENTNYWVLDEKNIRIYRILFKEIKEK